MIYLAEKKFIRDGDIEHAKHVIDVDAVGLDEAVRLANLYCDADWIVTLYRKEKVN